MKRTKLSHRKQKRQDLVLYPITLSVPYENQRLLTSQICAFNSMHAQGYKIVPQYVFTDADISFCSQDRLQDFLSYVLYPVSWGNGYFLYYDKRYINIDSLHSLDAVVNDCKQSGKMFSFALESSAWYASSFFIATGCITEWGYDGKDYTLIYDDIDSDKGFVSAKAMNAFIQSGVYKNSSSVRDFGIGDSAVVVSGLWDYTEARLILGSDLGMAELPCFTYHNKDYHLGSVSGGCYYALRDFNDAAKSEAIKELMHFLTSDACQLQNIRNIGLLPNNKSLYFTGKSAFDAFYAQDKYALPQKPVHPLWWRIADALAHNIGLCKSDDEIKLMLSVYSTAIKGVNIKNNIKE